jgi:hypothetical protein
MRTRLGCKHATLFCDKLVCSSDCIALSARNEDVLLSICCVHLSRLLTNVSAVRAACPGGQELVNDICQCPANTFLDQGACSPCPDSATSLPGSIVIDACKCLPNTFLNATARACTPCPQGATSLQGSSSPAACSEWQPAWLAVVDSMYGMYGWSCHSGANCLPH